MKDCLFLKSFQRIYFFTLTVLSIVIFILDFLNSSFIFSIFSLEFILCPITNFLN